MEAEVNNFIRNLLEGSQQIYLLEGECLIKERIESFSVHFSFKLSFLIRHQVNLKERLKYSGYKSRPIFPY